MYTTFLITSDVCFLVWQSSSNCLGYIRTNLYGGGRKQSLPILRYYPNICPEGLRKTTRSEMHCTYDILRTGFTPTIRWLVVIIQMAISFPFLNFFMFSMLTIIFLRRTCLMDFSYIFSISGSGQNLTSNH
jgi:hypothetical protein